MRVMAFDKVGSFSGPVLALFAEMGWTVHRFASFQGQTLNDYDMIFCEWCDDVAVLVSRQKFKGRLVIRLRSYEAFTQFPAQVDWSRVDSLVFVSNHVRDYVLGKFNIKCPNFVIPNGIDIGRFSYQGRQPKAAPDIAFIAEVSYKKGWPLFQQLLAAIPQANFHAAGKILDDRFWKSFTDFNAKAGITNFRHEGYQNQINDWLEPMDYLVCTSVWEGQCRAIMEAMAKGIKPLIYSFPGAENLYPPECQWSTIDQFKTLLANGEYDSSRYRAWIKDKGWTLHDYRLRWLDLMNSRGIMKAEQVAKGAV